MTAKIKLENLQIRKKKRNYTLEKNGKFPVWGFTIFVAYIAIPSQCKGSTQHVQTEIYNTKWVDLFFGTISTLN
jgi:hypothetical protein